MLFGVPQFIDIEDKIAGPLTGKQLLWMFGMGAALLVLWNTLEKKAFFVAAIPVTLLFCAFAFYRPYNQSLAKFVGHSLVFLFRSKVYVWKRTGSVKNEPSVSKSKNLFLKKEEKKYTQADIESFANFLDSSGYQRDEKIMEIIKEREKNKLKKKHFF